MKPGTTRIRRWILAALTLIIFGAFVARLMQIQIVDAQLYRSYMENRTVSTQVIKAVRGEITDRNGLLLAANRMGYDVVIEKAFFPSEQQNDIILELIALCEKLGEEWNDTLPVSKTAPFRFESTSDGDIDRLRERTKTQSYASAEDIMYWLISNYKLEAYTPQEARKIAGVRYEMDLRDFSLRIPYTFATNIDISSVIQIRERSHALPGVDVVESAIRYYPEGLVAPHIVGTIGLIYPEEYEELKKKGYALNDVVGKSGVEGALESFLRGKDGQRDILSDSWGEVIGASESISPVPGNTVVLTLDADLQLTAQESLEAQIKFLNATAAAGKGKEASAGAAVMLEVKTGKLLAAATYPSYDLSTYKQDYAKLLNQEGPEPLLNRALMGQYAPGSIFKPCVAIAGLSSGVIDSHSTVFCGGVYTVYQGYQPKCLSVHGNISLNRALSQSCNIYFYDVGRRTGIDIIDKVARQLGLGEATGIEIREAPGRRSTPETLMTVREEEWSAGDVLQTSIGQLVQQYTPLQLANYVATIANKGTRMKVSIVDEIRDYSTGEVIQPFEPVVEDRMSDIAPEVFDTVINDMVSVSHSSYGSARGTFMNYPIPVASKTGTPETTTDLLNSTFICFAPADDPQVAIAVVIENGYHGYTGAPVAKALFDAYFDIDVRAPVASGPQQLKDERARAATESSGTDAPAPSNPSSASAPDNEADNTSSSVSDASE